MALDTRLDDTVDETTERIDAALAAARSFKETIDGYADDLIGAFNKSAKEQPIATLAVAIGVGLVLGALIKR